MAFLDLVYYGNSVQTWLIALALSLVVFLGLELAKNLVSRQLAALVQRTDNDWDNQLEKLLARTRIWFLLVLSIYAGSQVLSLSPAARDLLEKVTVFVLLIQVAIWGNNLINYLIGRYLRITSEKDSESKATVSILGLVARIGLYTIIVLLLLDNLGFEISTLIAGLGIGGIAIALAAQNILSDLFGSLTILLDKPFVVGDFILVDNFYGTVEHIGLKSTRIRSLSGEQLVFSNHDLLNSRIQNYRQMQERRVVFTLRINYQTPYEKLAAIPSLLKEIIEAQGNDAQFVNLSQNIAGKLAVAQTNRTIPGGIVVVIEGACGNPSRSFMCVIKAEPHGGFTKRQADGHLTLEYIKELILTPQAKLYKIGAFLRHDPAAATPQEPANGWKAFLFDDLITQGNKLSAAQYFYETFLGLAFPSNSAFQTKQFHALTKEFIRNANVDSEKKIDLLNALTTYLKTDQAATIQVDVFSQNYLGDAILQDAYTAYMGQKNFPATAIHKDLSEVQSQLRFRKLTFGHDIKLTAPADQFENYVRVESIDGDTDEHGNVPKWTKITVRDHIRDQE